MPDEMYLDLDETNYIAKDALFCLARDYSVEMYAAERGIPLGELEAILALHELETIINEYNEGTDKNE